MDAHGPLSSGMTVFEAFTRQVQTFPGKVALQDGTKAFTYAQLARAIEYLQVCLGAQGCAPQEKIAWAVLEGSSFIVLSYAVTGLEGVAVPLDPYASAEEWQRCCAGCDVTTLIVSTTLVTKAQKLFAQNQQLRFIGTITWQDSTPVLQQLAARPGMECAGESRAGDAFLLCTSGTTGKPKCAILTHTNLLANQEAVCGLLDLSSADTLLVLKPLFHSSSIMEMLLQLQIGGKLVFAPRFLPHALPGWMKQTQCTLLCLVPTMVRELLSELRSKQLFITDRLTISVAAGVLDAASVTELTRYMVGTHLFYGYGLTEASPRVSTLLPTEWSLSSGSAGKALPGVELAIWNDRSEVVAPGTIGEVVVKGPNVMRGYYKDPVLTNQVLQDGWLHTKDLGWLDTQGYLFISGRKDDLINCGGQKVMPQEIEHVLQRCPLVREAVVCSAPDERLSQIPIAFLTRQSENSTGEPSLLPGKTHMTEADLELEKEMQGVTNELLDFCRQHLAPFKIPRRVYWLKALPLTASGKVRRQLLSAFDEKDVYGFQRTGQ